MAFSTGYVFTIKVPVYCVFLIALAYGIKPFVSIPLGIFSILFYAAVECIPYFSSIDESWYTKLSPVEMDVLLVCLISVYISAFISNKILRNYLTAVATIHHQNIVMNQMSSLNNKLQEYAKNHGEEAAQNERLRITRDMHDSCGYAFVNITAIMDAAMSNPHIEQEKLQETLMTVRNLASKGLKETRKTLHQIREVENPAQNNLLGIYEVSKIFMEITGINVEIASGNIKNSYGSTVNSIILHTMQEGLTNAIRHGRAQNIFISFWDEKGFLTMVIKDDGIGSTEVIKGIGLAGMEERLEKVNGSLQTSTPVEGGFRLEITIPLVDLPADELKI